MAIPSRHITQILKYDKDDSVGLHVIVELPYQNIAHYLLPEVLSSTQANLKHKLTTRPDSDGASWFGVELRIGGGKIPKGGWTAEAIIEEFKRALGIRGYRLDDYAGVQPGDFPPGYDGSKRWIAKRGYKAGEC